MAGPRCRGPAMSVPSISLAQQIESVRFAETRQRSFASGLTVKPMRGKSAEEYDLQRLSAAARTLEWLQANEAAIKAFLALPAPARSDGLAMAEEIERKRALAAAGGPAR